MKNCDEAHLNSESSLLRHIYYSFNIIFSSLSWDVHHSLLLHSHCLGLAEGILLYYERYRKLNRLGKTFRLEKTGFVCPSYAFQAQNRFSCCLTEAIGGLTQL